MSECKIRFPELGKYEVCFGPTPKAIVRGDLAFENFTDDCPSTLWRVVWCSSWGKDGSRTLRCTDYFSSKESMNEYFEARTSRYELIRIDVYDNTVQYNIDDWNPSS